MYLKLTNGVPAKYTLVQLRRDNPETSFPKQISEKVLAGYDVYLYARPTPPEYDRLTWRLVDGNFEQDEEGNWILPYVLEEMPLDRAKENVRARRTSLLSGTDWIVVRSYESGEPVPAAWVSYRQALRDITAQEGFPYSVVWPAKPE